MKINRIKLLISLLLISTVFLNCSSKNEFKPLYQAKPTIENLEG